MSIWKDLTKLALWPVTADESLFIDFSSIFYFWMA